MTWHIYVRKGMVFVPTVARTEAGFYMDIEPVEVAAAADLGAIQLAVKSAVARGNPRVPTPTRATFPKPVVLKHAAVKSWSAFERGSLCWVLHESKGIFQIIPQRKAADGRGWVDDGDQIESLQAGTNIEEFAKRVAELIQSSAARTP
jgi:hypothetical protein